ncbi:hypothetical protein BYT27DRAFT_6831655 [Phlegmacium glaucopus]|nr:hypothetical protein BYT27DRAFT_6831655 [Phlegmacium glaucopus]
MNCSSKRKGAIVSRLSYLPFFIDSPVLTALSLFLKVDFQSQNTTANKKPHTLDGRIPPKLAYGDVGTVPRFCFLTVANQRYKEYRRFSGTMPHVMVISSDGYFYSYSGKRRSVR